jgi:hypothetical protein
MNSLASAEVALEEGDPKSLGLVTDIVCFVVLILTLLGAGWMTVSMLRKQYTAGKGSTVRSRLVLFLVFGDFMSVSFLAPSWSCPCSLLEARVLAWHRVDRSFEGRDAERTLSACFLA